MGHPPARPGRSPIVVGPVTFRGSVGPGSGSVRPSNARNARRARDQPPAGCPLRIDAAVRGDLAGDLRIGRLAPACRHRGRVRVAPGTGGRGGNPAIRPGGRLRLRRARRGRRRGRSGAGPGREAARPARCRTRQSRRLAAHRNRSHRRISPDPPICRIPRRSGGPRSPLRTLFARHPWTDRRKRSAVHRVLLNRGRDRPMTPLQGWVKYVVIRRCGGAVRGIEVSRRDFSGRPGGRR